MRTSTIQIIISIAFLFFCSLGSVLGATSRVDCLEKLGNSVTRAQLDSCVSGGLPAVQNNQSSGINTSSEEATCQSIGFKKKTEEFASCVLELINRKTGSAVNASNDPDDVTCRKYGFKLNTDPYALCRQQIAQARQEAKRQQEEYAVKQSQYAAQQKQKNIQANLALMQIGLGMMGGGNAASGGSASVAPVPPSSAPKTYILPNNKMMTCTTTGQIFQCF